MPVPSSSSSDGARVDEKALTPLERQTTSEQQKIREGWYRARAKQEAELLRLQVLQDLSIADTPNTTMTDEPLQNLVKCASAVVGTPVALVRAYSSRARARIPPMPVCAVA